VNSNTRTSIMRNAPLRSQLPRRVAGHPTCVALVIGGPEWVAICKPGLILRHAAGTLHPRWKSDSGDQFAVRRVIMQSGEAKIVVKINKPGIVIAVGNLQRRQRFFLPA